MVSVVLHVVFGVVRAVITADAWAGSPLRATSLALAASAMILALSSAVRTPGVDRPAGPVRVGVVVGPVGGGPFDGEGLHGMLREGWGWIWGIWGVDLG